MTEWLSRLIQPRGLKSSDFVINTDASSRGLYSLVDWNDKFPTMRTRDKMSRLIQPRGLKSCSADGFRFGGRSRLIQPRGLKFNWKWAEYRFKCRGLYSLVDWNMQLCVWMLPTTVEAYTASWIEIWCAATVSAAAIGRGLYSLVDCNSGGKDSLCMAQSRGLYSLVDWNVVAICTMENLRMSRLIQPRGLKCTYKRSHKHTGYSRGLYSLVGWNCLGRPYLY